jgi:23S rRNA pseudouridine1911/1915/1917 synthase
MSPCVPLRPETTTLLQWLAGQFPRGKKQTFKQMLAQGRIRVNGLAASRLDQTIRSQDRVQVLPRRQAAPPTRSASLRPLSLVQEDHDLLVINKPAGLLTSTVASERRATALAIVRQYVAASDPKARVGLIHRLDRDASGLLVFSKSHRAYKSLKTQFFHHTVERTYEAIVQGIPSPRKGRIESLLIERADGTVRSTAHSSGKAQRAITDYEVVRSRGGKSLVRINLLTGRKHQIRVHLAERGHPIVGDRVYGQSQTGELQLLAVRLAIDHPATGERMIFSIPQTLAFAE